MQNKMVGKFVCFVAMPYTFQKQFNVDEKSAFPSLPTAKRCCCFSLFFLHIYIQYVYSCFVVSYIEFSCGEKKKEKEEKEEEEKNTKTHTGQTRES